MTAPPPPRARPRLTHTGRRVLAWVVAGVVMLGVSLTAIYLGDPQRWHREHAKTRTTAQETTKTTQVAPGVVDVEVKRSDQTQKLRFRQVGKQVTIENVTPPPPPKTWWQKLRGR
jgi:hypothetical protein